MPFLYVVLEKSKRPAKKFQVSFYEDETLFNKVKTVHFGSAGYEDFLNHKDIERRERYKARHSKIFKKDGKRAVDDIFSPSFWALHLLWNKPTLEESIKDMEKKFSMKFIKK